MAHDGYIHGKFLHLIPGGQCFLTMTHEGVPDNQYDSREEEMNVRLAACASPNTFTTVCLP